MTSYLDFINYNVLYWLITIGQILSEILKVSTTAVYINLNYKVGKNNVKKLISYSPWQMMLVAITTRCTRYRFQCISMYVCNLLWILAVGQGWNHASPPPFLLFSFSQDTFEGLVHVLCFFLQWCLLTKLDYIAWWTNLIWPWDWGPRFLILLTFLKSLLENHICVSKAWS